MKEIIEPNGVKPPNSSIIKQKKRVVLEAPTNLGRTIPLYTDFVILNGMEVQKNNFKPLVQLSLIRPEKALRENEYVTEFTIPSKICCCGVECSVESISAYIFGKPDQMDYIRIGSSIHPIGKLIVEENIRTILRYAFYELNADTIVWPHSCHTIFDNAFQNSRIKHFEGMEDITEIQCAAFFNSKYMESFDWPKNCTEIPTQCFECCCSLKEIRGIENVTSIGKRAFALCESLKTFDWPVSCNVIPKECFCKAINLEEININAPISKIEDNVFVNTKITEVDLSDSFECDIEDAKKDSKIKYKMSFYAI